MEEKIEKTFSVGESARLSVSNVRGEITVQGEERDDVQITAVKHLEKCKHPERVKIEMSQDGDHVVAKTRYPEKHHKKDSQLCKVDYDVRVPAHCDVNIRQVSGVIHVNGTSGRVDVDAVQGAVQLHKISGHTQVKAVSATVDGDHWSGRARVSTVSGSVQIADAQLSRIKANTVSGDLLFQTTLDENGRYDFNSISGDVTFYVPAERGLNSRGTTISGHLLCDLPHEFSRRSRSGWRATINGGGPPVRFNSISGDLELLAAKQA